MEWLFSRLMVSFRAFTQGNEGDAMRVQSLAIDSWAKGASSAGC